MRENKPHMHHVEHICFCFIATVASVNTLVIATVASVNTLISPGNSKYFSAHVTFCSVRAALLSAGSTNNFWSAGMWTDLDDVPFDNTSPAWLTEGPELTFNGHERLYSQPLRLECGDNQIDGMFTTV